MPALPAAARDLAFDSHNVLLARMTRLFELEFNPQDVYNAIVSEEDRDIMAKAKALGMTTSSYHSYVTFEFNDNQVQFDLRSCGPLPKYAFTSRYHLNPWEFAEPVKQWADNLDSVHTKFETGRQVLGLLFDVCISPKQVRYALPGIVTLLGMGQHPLASKLSASAPVRNMPTFPAGARQAIADYNALIAQASLLPDRPHYSTSNVQFEFKRYIKKPWE